METKPKAKTERKGYRARNRYESFDDMLRKAMEPSRKARRYSN